MALAFAFPFGFLEGLGGATLGATGTVMMVGSALLGRLEGRARAVTLGTLRPRALGLAGACEGAIGAVLGWTGACEGTAVTTAARVLVRAADLDLAGLPFAAGLGPCATTAGCMRVSGTGMCVASAGCSAS